MRKNFVLASFAVVMAFAISASAQKVTDFSGTWVLDVSKSKLEERGPAIKSQTMKVTQDAAQIHIETTTERAAPADGAGAQRGEGRGGGFGGGDVPATYTLDGKETIVEQESRGGKIPVKFSAKYEGAKLHLLQSRTFSTPNGDITAETKGTWELSADGKTLTIDREMSSPRGTSSTTLVYNKQ